MAKQKKLTQLERTKLKMRQEQTKIQKQREAALGEASGIYKALMLAKPIMLGLFPLVFFLYSPLLFPLLLVYASTFFVLSRMEKKANKDIKKASWIKFRRWDGIIAISLIGVILFNLILSASIINTKKVVFEGKSQAEIVTMLKTGDYGTQAKNNATKAAEILVKEGVNLTRGQKYTLQVFTLNTGYRGGFIPAKGFAFGFGRAVNSENSGSESGHVHDENCDHDETNTVTDNGGKIVLKGKNGESDIVIEKTSSSGLSDSPFLLGYTRAAYVINISALIVMAAGGAWIWRNQKKKETELFGSSVGKNQSAKQTEKPKPKQDQPAAETAGLEITNAEESPKAIAAGDSPSTAETEKSIQSESPTE